MEPKFKKGEKAYIQMPVEVKTIDKEAGTLEAIFSTQDVDRHGDVVLQDGWDLSNFKKNPVILNSHNYGDAAEVIGKASGVKIDQRKLQGKITFAVNENPKAKVIFDLYAGGFLNAFSVGFIPAKFKQNKDGSTDWFTIEEAELLEVSAVSVPANARALAKAKGIDIDLINTKENDDTKDTGTEPDAGSEAKGDADALPKSDEVPPADETTPPGNGDGGEGGQKTGDEETDKPAGTTDGDEAVLPSEVTLPADSTLGAPNQDAPSSTASYQSKVVKAIRNIESEEKRQLQKAADIIQGLLDGDQEGTRAEHKVIDQIRKRKVNQAIRILLKTK